MMKVDSKCLITGGGGYIGFHLANLLTKKGFDVVLFDIAKPLRILSNVAFIKGDTSNYNDIYSALDGINCVIHMASYGMSGREQLQKKRIYEVNFNGTNNVLRACIERGVQRLVYTSTYNVVFGGIEIINGDETLPYFPLEKQPDEYSKTKSMAEQLVLAANGTRLKFNQTNIHTNIHTNINGNDKPASTRSGFNNHFDNLVTANLQSLESNETTNLNEEECVLRTCALRLAGVYGPGEQRHLPRIVNYLEMGLFKVVYGAVDSKVDFLHIDNLIDAHWRACLGLTKENNYVAAGQSYFISDNSPINNFEFFRPLVVGLGHTFPTVRLPLSFVYYFAFLTELVHLLVGNIYNFQPLLTRTEVYKTGVTHYFSIEKASHDLGYYPTKENDLSDAVEWFKNEKRKKALLRKPAGVLAFVKLLFMAIIFAVLLMSLLPYVG